MKNSWPTALAIIVLAASIAFLAMTQRYALHPDKLWRIDRLTGQTAIYRDNEWMILNEDSTP